MRRAASVLFATVLTGLCACGPGQPLTFEPREPLRILFVGNSYTYTNDVPGIVANMARAEGYSTEVESVTGGGYYVGTHLLQPVLIPLLERERFDVVVIQGHYFEPFTKYEQFEEGVEEIVERSRGARIVLYQTWPHRADAEELIELGISVEQMWAGLEQGYANAAAAVDAEIAPVGAAWVYALALEPNMALYATDGFHPSAIGSFLSALVLYGTLFDETSVDNDWVYSGWLPEDVETLREIADHTVANAP